MGVVALPLVNLPGCGRSLVPAVVVGLGAPAVVGCALPLVVVAILPTVGFPLSVDSVALPPIDSCQELNATDGYSKGLPGVAG